MTDLQKDFTKIHRDLCYAVWSYHSDIFYSQKIVDLRENLEAIVSQLENLELDL